MANDDLPYDRCRVVWAGGSQARSLAELLAGDDVTKAGSSLASTAVDSQADLLVLSNRTSLDLCNVAIPYGFNRDATQSVVAAMGGGPHSTLAAMIADWIAQRLGVPASAVYGHSDPDDLEQAEDVLNKIVVRLPKMDARTIEAASPAAMVGSLPAGTLLIVGASGGSWFQRRFFGPGARIQAKAPSGTIVVNHSPPRVYQAMQPPIAYGPNMRVADALQLSNELDVVVAEDGKLLGVVKAATLRDARQDIELHEVMDDGVFLSTDDEFDEAISLISVDGGDLIPVVDDQARLVGCVSASDLSPRPLS
jgi:hypothetical protein